MYVCTGMHKEERFLPAGERRSAAAEMADGGRSVCVCAHSGVRAHFLLIDACIES